MTINIPDLPYEEAVERVTAIVEGVGRDHVYESDPETGLCVYFAKDGAPACVVGHLFADLGVEAEDLDESENADQTVNMLVGSGRLELTDERTVGFLSSIQRHQDRGVTWGDALEKATAP